MTVQDVIVETIEYRIVAVHPVSHTVFAIDADGCHRLPRVRIPQCTRPAEQLQKAIRATWKLNVFVVDFLPVQNGFPYWAVVELLVPCEDPEFSTVRVEELSDSELPEEQRIRLMRLLSVCLQKLPSQLGWIDDAVAWVEAATQRKLASKAEIEQLNAGGGFSLIRFHMEDGQYCWLKATGASNLHEYSITQYLSQLPVRYPDPSGYVPAVLAAKPEWNAWIMSGEARSIAARLDSAPHAGVTLGKAVQSLARLQIATVGRGVGLLQAGAFDQRPEILNTHAEEMFDYLEEAMALQTSTKAPRLDSRSLRLMCATLKQICERVDALAIPASVVHGDLNPGNIVEATNCQFIDWSEPYLGVPLASLQHLLLLNHVEDKPERERLNLALTDRYREEWSAVCAPDKLDEGFRYMPFLAAASSLYGRGSWLTSSARDELPRQSYARTVAREMNRALAAVTSREALCH